MRILVIDDRQVDRRIGVQVAREFGEVREAASVEAARSVFASGWRPVVVLADLHMAGADPIESFAAVLEAADDQRTVVIALTGDLGDTDLVRRFRDAFPSSRLLAKDNRAIRDVLAAIRVDEAGHAVSTMDQGSIASHDQIVMVIEQWWAGKLKGFGISDYWVRKQIEGRLSCLTWRERLAIGVGVALATVVALGAGSWLARAAWESFKQAAAQ